MAKRRQVVEYKGEVEKEKEETRSKQVNSMRELLTAKVLNGQLLERQNDELNAQYQGNLLTLYDGLGKGKEETKMTLDKSDACLEGLENEVDLMTF